MAHLHPTGHHHHPESEASAALPDRGAPARDRGWPRPGRGDRARPRPRLRRADRRALGGVLARRRHDRPTDDLGGGATRCRLLDPRGRDRWVRARASAGTPRPLRPRDGVLHLRERRRRSTTCAGGARHRAGRDRRLGRASRQRHRGSRPRRRLDPVRLAPRVAVLSRHGRPGDERRDDRQHPARGRLGRRRLRRGVSHDRRACRALVRAGAADRLGRVRRARRRPARRTWR